MRTFGARKMSTKPAGLSATKNSPSDSLHGSWDLKAERRVLRKCDFHVIPILYTLYMLSYLDRINIGNARIEGLERDLGMSGNDYNIAVQNGPNAAFKNSSVPIRIFIIEGLLTAAVAVVSKWLIADWPENAKFLDDNERALLVHRLEKDEGHAKMDRLNKKTLKRILSDWKIWVAALMFFGTCTSTYSLSYYLPTVLKEFGYTSSDAQVQTIPIYAAALVVAFLTAWISDTLRHRYTFVILGAAINAIGYVVLLAQASLPVKVRYMALYLVECGLWIGSPVEVVWLTSNLGGHYKRAIGSAIQVATGNMSGFVASNVFITSQAPRYPVGYGVALAMTVVAAAAATVLFLGLRRENRRRDCGGRDYRLQVSGEGGDDIGDDHPGFRYAL
ncbi:MAG: hypothetical protein Q9225_003541 [Loekoesia sp. 1 TL-2023]